MDTQNPPPEYIEAEVIEPGGLSREQALSKIRTPAICLIVLWVLTLVAFLTDILFIVTGMNIKMLEALSANVPPEMQAQLEQIMIQSPGLLYSLSFLAPFIGILALFGAVKMLKLQTYGLALATAIISLIPCFGPCCCCSMLLIPFGIWALVVLCDAQVKQHFN